MNSKEKIQRPDPWKLLLESDKEMTPQIINCLALVKETLLSLKKGFLDKDAAKRELAIMVDNFEKELKKIESKQE